MNEEKFCKKCSEEIIDKIPGCPLQCSSPKCKAYQRKKKTDFSQKTIVWLMGGPGSGKGTQCQEILKHFKFTHISVGNLIKKVIEKGGDQTKCLENSVKHGTIVPTDIILPLILEAMEACVEDTQGYVIDGFPRDKRQAFAFNRHIGQVNVIIYLEATHETMQKRLKSRAEKEGLDLDNIDNRICERLKIFDDNIDELMKEYKNETFFKRINAERPAKDVFTEVQKEISCNVATVTDKK